MKLAVPFARRRARVEMIPLIDCVFILLVFFIYSMLAMTVQRGLVVTLPSAGAAAATRDTSTVITVTGDGMLLVDDEPVDADALRGVVAERQRAGGDGRYVINADRQAEHGWVVRVLDDLRASGVTQVTVLAREAPP